MIRPILKYGDSTLHNPAQPVDAITPEIERLIDDMIETMYAAPGIGLAAPQVGVPLRIFVVDISVGRDPKALLALVNPERGDQIFAAGLAEGDVEPKKRPSARSAAIRSRWAASSV